MAESARPVPPPRIVLEGVERVPDAEVARLRRAGFEVVASLAQRGATGPTVVRLGVVATRDDAEAALLVALAGSGLLVAAAADSPIIDRLVDDLRRLGSVDHRIAADAGPSTPILAPEARAILAMLAEGLSLGEAARTLGLARRTADRRLAEARRALGADRTTEAIARARRGGWLDGVLPGDPS